MKLIEQHTIASSNTFGATFWTDGKVDLPMRPDQPWLVMCPHCQAPLWMDELEEIGEVEAWENAKGKFKSSVAYKTPSFDDYISLLEKDLGSLDKERYLRLRLWWAGNDARRISTIEIPISSREVSNLTAFVEMLDEANVYDLVMKAEALRELGHFANAQALLARSFDQDVSPTVEIIKDLLAKGDRFVTKIGLK